MLTAATASYLIISVLPLQDWVLRPLEERFPAVRELPENVEGIIVLGGSELSAITLSRGQPSLSESAERLTSFLALARRYPDARLVFTGGSSAQRPEETDVATARVLLSQLGLDTGRVMFEDRSRNTYENAVLSRALVGSKQRNPWLLITSASHMPRSVGAFRKAGWTVTPYPVDYLTAASSGLIEFRPGGSLNALSRGLKEWLGLVAYRLLGRTSALFPRP